MSGNLIVKNSHRNELIAEVTIDKMHTKYPVFLYGKYPIYFRGVGLEIVLQVGPHPVETHSTQRQIELAINYLLIQKY